MEFFPFLEEMSKDPKIIRDKKTDVLVMKTSIGAYKGGSVSAGHGGVPATEVVTGAKKFVPVMGNRLQFFVISCILLGEML
jgi:hypothetical protein